MIKAIIFDAFGTLFKVTSGGSARAIMKNIADYGTVMDEKAFLEEWKDYYKKHTAGACTFMTLPPAFVRGQDLAQRLCATKASGWKPTALIRTRTY